MTSRPDIEMPPPKPLTMIVAATRSLGIGSNGNLPWRLKNEMAYFARVTKRVPDGSHAKNAVLMGRKTWESIPPKFRPLQNRINIVVSRTVTSLPDALLATSVEEALQLAEKENVDRVFVIGGAEVYRAAMEHPHAQNVLLTRIDTEFDCDTFFPDFDTVGSWQKKSYEEEFELYQKS